ncbi:unnamed protein product [Miscanthus lutarioriparius]|uniref:Uncharacterized protein n=1 Tax=Miscanthus lutarioriparius TaxID=422564 RepID=A0A811S0C5_9POAL|nr:unnamed protein product [Miscanthus lutarioriparius]
MEEDPLIPLVHVWNNAAFDHASSSAWHAHSPAPASAGREAEGDKENHRPDPEPDVEAEIGHIEAEILRLSSRLHHLRTSKQSEPSKRGEVAPAHAPAAKAAWTRGLSLGPLDVAAAVNPNPLTTDKQQPRAAQGLKPIKQAPAARGRGVSLGPLDIVAANPRVPSAAATAPQRKIQGEGGAARPILRPIKEPSVQRRRGVSLGPLEIHNGVGSKPWAAAARVKTFTNKLGALREEGQRSKQHTVPARPWPSSNTRQGTAARKAKARSGSMSPSRSRRQSTSKATETRAGNAKAAEVARAGNTALVVNKVPDELKPKGLVVGNQTSNAATAKRPAGSSKVRVVPSRYSITPGSSLAAVSQDKRSKQSLQDRLVLQARGRRSEQSSLSRRMTSCLLKQLPRLQSCSQGSGPCRLLMRARVTRGVPSVLQIWSGSDPSSPPQPTMAILLRPTRHGWLNLNHLRQQQHEKFGFDQ